MLKLFTFKLTATMRKSIVARINFLVDASIEQLNSLDKIARLECNAIIVVAHSYKQLIKLVDYRSFCKALSQKLNIAMYSSMLKAAKLDFRFAEYATDCARSKFAKQFAASFYLFESNNSVSSRCTIKEFRLNKDVVALCNSNAAKLDKIAKRYSTTKRNAVRIEAIR